MNLAAQQQCRIVFVDFGQIQTVRVLKIGVEKSLELHAGQIPAVRVSPCGGVALLAEAIHLAPDKNLFGGQFLFGSKLIALKTLHEQFR